MAEQKIVISTNDVMTVRQAAREIGVHFATVYRWVDARVIAGVKLGGILFIPKSEVERLKNSQATKGPVA